MSWKCLSRWVRISSGALILALSAWWMVSLLAELPSGAEAPLTGRMAESAPVVNAAAAIPVFTAPTAPPPPVAAPRLTPPPTTAPTSISPDLEAFIQQVADGAAAQVRGVYVAGVLALPIVQQPESDPTFVSSSANVVTQFGSAAPYGVTGLLAHNYLAGDLFYQLQTGHQGALVYGDGSLRRFEIVGSYTFQKLSPDSTHSDMIDLATGYRLSTTQVFNRFYRGDDHVTFQTCLERDGLANWGLTFIVADPID
jgi:hypothetical protein